MILMLKRAYTKPWTPREKIAVFDLWNDKYNYGFEVHLIIDNNVSFERIRENIGVVRRLEVWDEIFYGLKKIKE